MFSISIVFVLLTCLKHYLCLFQDTIIETFSSTDIRMNALINLSPNLNLYLSPNQIGTIDTSNTYHTIKSITTTPGLSASSQNAIPLEEDKFILICSEAFAVVLDTNGNERGNKITYDAAGINPINTKCHGFVTQNTLFIYFFISDPDDPDNLFDYYFFQYNLDRTTYAISGQKQFMMQKPSCDDCLESILIRCAYINKTKKTFCAYFDDFFISAGFVSSNFDSITNEVNTTSEAFEVAMLPLSDDKVIVFGINDFLHYHEFIFDENSFSFTQQFLTERQIDFSEKLSLSKINEYSFFLASTDGNSNINITSISIDDINNVDSTFTKTSLENFQNPIKRIYIASFNEESVNVVISAGQIPKSVSYIIQYPNCKNLEYKSASDTTIDFIIDLLTSENVDDYIIDSVKTVNNLGNFTNTGKLLNYTSPYNGNETIFYKIKKNQTESLYSSQCSISISTCDYRCETCTVYSDNPSNSKCDTCKVGYAKFQNTMHCILNTEIPDGYYLDSDTFKPCYSTCKKCSSEGSFLDHKCTECLSPLVFSSDQKQCSCDIIKYGWYLDSNSQYVCSSSLSCPSSHPYLTVSTNECVTQCAKGLKLYSSKCYSSCPSGTDDQGTTCKAKDPIKDAEDNIVDNYENNPIQNTDNMTIQIYNTSKAGQEEAANAQSNVSTIDLGECEDILRDHYSISKDEPLLIMKVDIEREDQITNQVEYSVYDITGKKLNLSLCNSVEITVSSPIKNSDSLNLTLAADLAESGYDLYNSSDPFYTDVCTPYTTEDNTDIPLEDRKKDYYKNISFCETGCTYKGINLTTNKVSCSCSVKETLSTESTDFSFNDLGAKFKSVLSESNLKVIKCYKLVFDWSNLLKNVGSWIIFGITFLEFVLIFVFIGTGLEPITKQINAFLENIPTSPSESSPINSSSLKKGDDKKKNTSEEIIQINRLSSNSQSNPSNPPRIKRTNLKTSPKIEPSNEVKFNIENNVDFNFDEENDSSVSDSNKMHTSGIQRKNSQSSYFSNNDNIESPAPALNHKSKSGKVTQLSLKNSYVITDDNKISKTLEGIKDDTNIFRYSSNEISSKHALETISSEKLDEKAIKKYTDEELNEMSYKEACAYDHRCFCKYYYSILKYSQLILFTFVLNTDYNLKILKISMFLFGLAMYIAFNTLFYTDSTMSHNYQNKGVIDIVYSLPKTIFSSIFCVIITFLLKILSLSQSQMQSIKDEKDALQAKKKSSKFVQCLKIKISIFYTLIIIFLFLFWYYIAAFCVVYKNTQIHLLKDTLMSFCLSMIYPFIICFVTACFRIWGLTSRTNCLYSTSKILQMF